MQEIHGAVGVLGVEAELRAVSERDFEIAADTDSPTDAMIGRRAG